MPLLARRNEKPGGEREREKKREEGKRGSEKAQIIHQIQGDDVVADAA